MYRQSPLGSSLSLRALGIPISPQHMAPPLAGKDRSSGTAEPSVIRPPHQLPGEDTRGPLVASGTLASASCGAHATNTALEAFAGQSRRGYCNQHQENVARHPRPANAGSDFSLGPDYCTPHTILARKRPMQFCRPALPQIRFVTSFSGSLDPAIGFCGLPRTIRPSHPHSPPPK